MGHRTESSAIAGVSIRIGVDTKRKNKKKKQKDDRECQKDISEGDKVMV